jgi:hypothetical protein
VAVVLLVAACGRTAPRQERRGPRDAGPRPDAFAPIDGGLAKDGGLIPIDAGMADAGFRDGGVRDAGFRDGGMRPDAGLPDECVPGLEGCRCRGRQCDDPRLACVDVDPTLAVCARICEADRDCIGSPWNAICRPWLFDLQACVTAEVQAGLQIEQSRENGLDMTGCPPGLAAFGRDALRQLDAIPPGRASCGLLCGPNGSCPAAYPYCTPRGLCALRQAVTGDVCSRTSAVGLCDTLGFDPGREVRCLPSPRAAFDPGDPTGMAQVNGFCAVTCDPMDPSACDPVADPGVGPGECVPPPMPVPGAPFVCAHQCRLFPDTCLRAGSFGLGASCSGEIDLAMGPSSFCLDVLPPVIDEADLTTGTTNGRCLTEVGGARRCQAQTICADDGMGGLCIRTCNSDETPTGCEESTVGNDVCDTDIIGNPGGGMGICFPN